MILEKKLSDINFFICSTFEDLEKYRATAINKIKSEAGIINAQEFFGARPAKPIDTCLQEVEKSNIFIILVAWRYGSKANDNKSFVELEYEKAVEMDLPVLVYFMEDSMEVLPKNMSKGEDYILLENFKNKLSQNHTINKFTTPDDLSTKIIQDLLQELPKHNFVIGKKEEEIIIENNLTAIKKFLTLPKIYYESELKFKVTLSDFTRAPDDECHAFYFDPGRTLKRSFTASDQALREELHNNSLYIFAEGSKAEELINLPSKQELTIIVKTIQGDLTWEEPEYSFLKRSETIPYDTGLPNIDISYYQMTGLMHTATRTEKIQTGSIKKSKIICGFEYVSLIE